MRPPPFRGEAALERFAQVLDQASDSIGLKPTYISVNRKEAVVRFALDGDAFTFFTVAAAAKVGKMQSVRGNTVTISLSLEGAIA